MTRNAHERMSQTSFIDLLDAAVEESFKEVSARPHRLRDKQSRPDRLRQWLQIQSAAFGETAMSGVADPQENCSVDAYLSGCLALRQGNRTTAKSLFERSASRSPALILPLFALASLLHNSGHTAEAIPHIRIALETAHSLLPISAARRPPAVEACFLPCSSCDSLFPSKSPHPLNFLLRFLPRSLLQGGGPPDSV